MQDDTDYVTGQINGPATALLIVGILNALMSLFVVVVGFTGSNLFRLGVAEGVIGIFCLIAAGVTVFGALSMRKLRSFGMAMTGAIFAMLPCISPCFLAGLPTGIWVLVKLSDPDIKNAFRPLSG